jgi:predicted amidophosphoribosyltransferase
MGPVQRRACCAGRFVARVPVRAKRVLLIDDVVTSGGQAREAIRALIAAGAADWRFAALAQATASPGTTGDGPER